MPTGLTYAQFVTQVANLAVVEETNSEFLVVLPLAIDYAELRIQRDLDLLQTSSTYVATLTTGDRRLTAPAGTFVVTEQLNLLTPAGTIDPETGTRNSLLPTTKEYIDVVYGASASTGVPRYFVPFNDNLWLVAPPPDDDYSIEIVGTARLPTLSSTNTTNFLSLYFPDLLVMATMIFISGYQRNFGKQSDDPAMAVSYESQYQALLKSATVEEQRKNFAASAWSSHTPAVVASPSR